LLYKLDTQSRINVVIVTFIRYKRNNTYKIFAHMNYLKHLLHSYA